MSSSPAWAILTQDITPDMALNYQTLWIMVHYMSLIQSMINNSKCLLKTLADDGDEGDEPVRIFTM